MKFFIKDLFSICGQIRRKLRIWSHLLKKSLMENFFFCAESDSMLCLFFGISFIMIHSLEAKAYFHLVLVDALVEGVHRRQENACLF